MQRAAPKRSEIVALRCTMTPTLTSPLTVPTPPLTPLTATRDNPMPIDALGERIAELAARIHAATYELLVMLREYDEGKGWTWPFCPITPGQVAVSVWAQLRAPGSSPALTG